MLTYTVSTSCHRVPHGENITGGVFVPVMGSAARARPFTDAQWHLFLQRSAFAAHFAAREPAVDFDHGFAVHGGFGLNHPDGVTDSGIAQAAGKAVVFDHAAQVEILDADHVESGNKAPRQLGSGVLAGIGDLLMQYSNPLFLPLVAVRAFHLAGQRLLLALNNRWFPSSNLKADRVYSADCFPPLRLKDGYLVRFSKKFANAVCRLRSTC